MPDVTFLVGDLEGAEDAEKLERALARLEFVVGERGLGEGAGGGLL